MVYYSYIILLHPSILISIYINNPFMLFPYPNYMLHHMYLLILIHIHDPSLLLVIHVIHLTHNHLYLYAPYLLPLPPLMPTINPHLLYHSTLYLPMLSSYHMLSLSTLISPIYYSITLINPQLYILISTLVYPITLYPCTHSQIHPISYSLFLSPPLSSYCIPCSYSLPSFSPLSYILSPIMVSYIIIHSITHIPNIYITTFSIYIYFSNINLTLFFYLLPHDPNVVFY